MTFSDGFEIGSMDELIDAIDELGFVPFFANGIKGLPSRRGKASFSV